jgi:predicted ATP-binding protein involved in virulence
MKLRKIKWASHPILDDLEIDLVNPTTNRPYSTIIFAGENGTGKTTILETISTFLNIGSFKPFSFIEYEANGDIFQAVPLEDKGMDSYYYKDFFIRVDKANGATTKIMSNKNNNPNLIQQDEKDPRHYGCLLSKPRADYKTSRIISSTTQELDKNKYDTDNNDDFTSLKQLLVDIQSEDNEDYREINYNRSKKEILPMSENEFESISKMHRFKNAFNAFFEKIKYNKVSTINNEKIVLFSKNGKDISLDNLSTGEKQIVFRGAFLLKNLKQLSGSIIMVDEPELSMHPKWQEKILDFYKKLFTNDVGEQFAQLFFASHSPGVISNALQDDDTKVIVLRTDDKGNIIPGDIEKPLVLPNTLAAEINYQAFDVASTDYHNALYGYIEAEGWLQTFKSIYPQTETYKRLYKDGSTTTTQITLSEKIRHIIHHPENHLNSYTPEQLKASIDIMRNFIKSQSQFCL